MTSSKGQPGKLSESLFQSKNLNKKGWDVAQYLPFISEAPAPKTKTKENKKITESDW